MIYCEHPDGLIPTCACGENIICPFCGYGHGSTPCKCERVCKTDLFKTEKVETTPVPKHKLTAEDIESALSIVGIIED